MPAFWIGAAIAAVGTAVNVRQSDIANDRAKRAEALKNRRARLEALREARVRRAQILQSAENTGTSGSSGAMGGVGSVQSQAVSNIGFADQINRLQQGILDAQTTAGYGAAAASIGGTVASNATQINAAFAPKPKK